MQDSAELRARQRLEQEAGEKARIAELAAKDMELGIEERRAAWEKEEEEKELLLDRERRVREQEVRELTEKLARDADCAKVKAKAKEDKKWAEREERRRKHEAEELHRKHARAEKELEMKRRHEQMSRQHSADLQREMSDRTNRIQSQFGSDISPEKAESTRQKLEQLRRETQRKQTASGGFAAEFEARSKGPEFVVPDQEPYRKREFKSAPTYEERHHDHPRGAGYEPSAGSKFARFYFDAFGASGSTVDRSSIDKDDKSWESFERKAASCAAIRLGDIPLPNASGCLDDEIFKRWAKRWHPDKFMQKFGNKLAAADKEAIEEAVKGVFQDLSAARK